MVLVYSRAYGANFVRFEAIQQVQFKNGELNARKTPYLCAFADEPAGTSPSGKLGCRWGT